MNNNPLISEFFSVDEIIRDDNELTVYSLYVIANFAKDLFRKKIEELDQENKFIRISKKEGIPKEVIDKAKELYKVVFKDKLAQLDDIKRKWREEHPEYYRMQPCLKPSYLLLNPINENLDPTFYELIDSMTLKEAVDAYKSVNQFLKSIPNKDLDPYCTELRPMLNYEYKDKYDDMIAQAHKDLDLIPQSEWIESLPIPISIVESKRLALDRQPAESDKYWVMTKSMFKQAILKTINKT